MDSTKNIGCCPYCGCEEYDAQEKTFSNGTLHIAALCKSCGKHIKYLPQDKPLAEILREVMPFGKHKGKPLSAILESDFDYVLWGAENLNKAYARKFKALLAPNKGLHPEA